MRRLVGTCVLVACNHSEPEARAVSATPADAAGAPTQQQQRPASVEAAPDAPLAWGTKPPQQGRFFPWVDGVCVHMETWPLADSVALTFGNGQGGAFVRSAWQGPSVGIALTRDRALQVVAPPPESYFDVVGFGGSSTALWATAQQGNPRMGQTDDQLFTWSAGSWSARTKLSKDDAPPRSARTTAVLQGRGAEPLFVRVVRPEQGKGTTTVLAADGSTKTAPLVAGWPKADDYGDVSLLRLADGAVVGLHAGEVRFAPALDAPAKTLAKDRKGTLAMRGATAYVATASRIFRITAAALQPLGGAGGGRLLPLDTGAYLVASDGKTFVLEGDSFKPRASLPEPLSAKSATASTMSFLSGSVADTDGVSRAWVVGKSGALYTFDGTVWDNVELPLAPFAATGTYRAERVLVLGPDDVVINARYIEKGLGWKDPEPYRALLRSKRPTETLRCEDPLGGSVSETTLKSWPPRAGDACATPFVTLFRSGFQSQFFTGGKYPQLAPLVKMYAGSITEFEVAGSKWAGVKVESTALGRELALAATKKQKALRPEVVCGTPEKVIREVSVR